MGRPGREAGQVQHNRNGEAEVDLPDVERSEPAVEVAQGGMLGWMRIRLQAARPMGGAMPTSDGDTRPMVRRPSVADGVADGGMSWAYRTGRTRPMAEPMMMRRTPGEAVRTSSLPVAPHSWSRLNLGHTVAGLL